MTTFLYIFLGVVGLIIVGAFVWRFASRRRSLPCPAWLRWLVEFDSPFAKTYRSDVILQRAEVEPGMTVLDVGCGPGRVAIPAAKLVGPTGMVLAVDIQWKMIRRVMEKAKAANLTNLCFMNVGVGEGKIGQEISDRALLVTVLGEIPNREAAIKEIYDALRPGGVLSVTEIIMDPHYQGRGTIVKLATAAGFREKAFFGNRFAFTQNLEK
jgi:ubiquinone/menaquinone biosynthesis C-methylase UbiE